MGGRARSRALQCAKGLRIRPTTDIIRETLFNSLGPRALGAAVCDLYAGCGSVGIEALSRGAAVVVFVDGDRRCVEQIEANLQATGPWEGAVVLRGQLPGAWGRVAAERGPFDVVFLDPPYGHTPLGELVRRLAVEGEGVAGGGVVVVQHSAAQELPEPDRQKRFGESILSFYEVERDRPADG